jgi:hypothetical protein
MKKLVSYGWVWRISLGLNYEQLLVSNFYNWPFNSYNCLKIIFFNKTCSSSDSNLVSRKERYCMYMEAHCRILVGRQPYYHPEGLASKVRGLAHRINWHPGRQSSHTGRFLLADALNGLYSWSNVS